MHSTYTVKYIHRCIYTHIHFSLCVTYTYTSVCIYPMLWYPHQRHLYIHYRPYKPHKFHIQFHHYNFL